MTNVRIGRGHGVVAAVLLAAGVLAGCSATTSSETAAFGGDSSSRDANGGESSAAPGEPGGFSGSSSGGESGATTPTTGEGNGENPLTGTLTAGVWDDNLNYDFFTKYITSLGARPGLPLFGAADRNAARTRALAPRGAVSELDVAFLVDTTGSMGDELRYIQRELSTIAGSIGARFPGTTPRFGLVFYRDLQDQYVTRSFDFSSDLQAVQANLDAQVTGGGGDYPEAVPEGLTKAVNLSWRQGSVARLAFWIADAPQHATEAQTTRAAIDTAVAKDVHVYPVAASGSDELTEATMRTAAQLTGGRYMFLTDDSGVGGEHKEPSIPCYQVTKFTTAMVRVVEGEMKGTKIEPAAGDVLRTVGNPTNGTCTLASNEQVVIY